MTEPVETYDQVHARLRKERGPARDHQCVDCGRPAEQWAYAHEAQDELWEPNKGPYTTDTNCYVPLCIPDHRKLDSEYRMVRKICGGCGAEFFGSRRRNNCSERCAHTIIREANTARLMVDRLVPITDAATEANVDQGVVQGWIDSGHLTLYQFSRSLFRVRLKDAVALAELQAAS
jgi:hypothetical protein